MSWKELTLGGGGGQGSTLSMCNGYASFSASRDVTSVVVALRSQIDAILMRKIEKPSTDIDASSEGLVDAVVQLLSSEDGDFGTGASYGGGAYGGGSYRQSGARMDDWECPGCGALVLGSKSQCFQCFQCRTPRVDDGDQGSGSTFGGARGAGGGFRHGGRGMEDWECPNCNALVFGSKSQCFQCGTPRLGSGGDGGYGGYGGGGRRGGRGGGRGRW
jgi:hypothetical protein